ncbi:hypothetical protein TEPIDINF_001331 [Tepidibacillus infernus]|uniref:Lipoprotein SmpA/OmlA domain-containing protein n=1 Tax=Tepidibacillus decaturensis TaxID=1413211 RepID=A0A135L4J5_9BACI|nr:hypothetical protein [Tepidibacillus decaturensis]KXG43881.1 hypothetical protein U473_07580 [Tepidibacillus decaturensis]
MKSFSKIIIGLLLLSLLLTGCNLFDNDSQKHLVEPQVPENPQTPKNPQNPSSGTVNTLQEAFPTSLIFKKPQDFMEIIIPGFRIGLTKEQIQEKLGKPNLVQSKQIEWQNLEEWIYDDVNGYRLELQFDERNQLINFQLSKYLTARGIVPTILNRQVPTPGSPLTYSELGFQEVILGSTVDEVTGHFDQPMMAYMSYDEMYGYDLAMVYQGITVHALLETEEPYVHLIETNDDGLIPTDRGIQVGSSVDEVIKQYGPPSYDWRETGDLIYSTDDYWFAIKFKIEDDKVQSISIYEAS